MVDSSFDCVLLSEVIEHLEAPHLTIREAARGSVLAVACS